MARVEHPRCPYCKGAVRPIDAKEACHRCMAWHHEECWEEYGRCAACQWEGGRPQRTRPQPKRPATLERLEDVPVPNGITLRRDGDRALVLTRSWFGCQLLFLAFFCVLWDGFMVVWFGIAIKNGQPMMALFGTLHAMVGIGLTYFTICGFVNTTTIEVERSRFRLRHHPLPWPGNQDLSAEGIDQLFCTRKVSHSENGTSVSYELHARLRQGRRGKDVKLLGGLQRLEQAKFIERQVEDFLGIEDHRVDGEWTG